jgi:hypothetical protein
MSCRFSDEPEIRRPGVFRDSLLVKGENIVYRAQVSRASKLLWYILAALLALTVIGIPFSLLILLLLRWNRKSTEIAITNKRAIANVPLRLKQGELLCS